MIPARSTTQVQDGLARLIDQYRGRPKIEGILTAYLRRVQEIENALWAAYDARLLTATTPVGVHLDTLGALVGEARQGRGDDDYRAAIRIRIRANRSTGTANDVIEVASLLPADNATYDEGQPRCFVVMLHNVRGVNGAVPLLRATRSVATRGELVYTTWPAAQDLVLGGHGATAATGLGWSGPGAPTYKLAMGVAT